MNLVFPHASKVDGAVNAVIKAVLGLQVSPHVREQLQLPTDYAGLQFQRMLGWAPLARLAAVIETGPVIRQHLSEWLSAGAEVRD